MSWCLRGGSPLTTALLLPTQHRGLATHRGEGDHKCKAVLGVGWGWSHPLQPPWVSRKGLGRVREDGPCPKLHQHPRSSSPKITHTPP